jgi:hypothetical protein
MRSDPLWNYFADPKALFLFELAWFDCDRLCRDARGLLQTNSSAAPDQSVRTLKRDTAKALAKNVRGSLESQWAQAVRHADGTGGAGGSFHPTYSITALPSSGKSFHCLKPLLLNNAA